jgi:hypothetical protein
MAAAEFEVHVNRGGRWSIESAEATEQGAIASAKRRLGMPGVEGVKVVTEVTSRIGKVSDKIIFEQAGKTGESGVITVAPLETTPNRCEKSSDLYGGNARLAMAKLFRNYSAKMNLTVSEVLYNARELKRVMEKDNIFSSAVGKVASLQSAQGDQAGAKGRRDELFAMIDEVVARANAAEKAELPSISAVGLKALGETIAGRAADASERDYLVRVAISRELMGERSFLGKLENAIKWAEGVDPGTAVDALDEFIADTLTDASVIQDVLGRRDSLLAAILAMLDLLDGQMTLAKAAQAAASEATATGERLNKLISASRLPGSVAVIADRAQSMIASRNALLREADPKDEEAAFRSLVERLVPVDAPVRASPEILMAVIERAARMINKGGDSGRNEAVAYVTGKLLEPARKVRFLLAAHEASPHPGLKAYIAELTKGWIADTRAATDFNPQSKNPALVMRAVTNLFYHVRDNAQADELKQPLTGHLENLLFEYVDKAQIIKMVDDPNRPLRARARLLMSMCLPDMLPPGKAVEAARTRVVEYLRQPDFTTKVVEDLTDPAEKEKALRELFDLMRRAGFK